jgi:hypothetical protein
MFRLSVYHDDHTAGYVLDRLRTIELLRDNNAEPKGDCRESFQMFYELRDQPGIAVPLHNLGTIDGEREAH